MKKEFTAVIKRDSGWWIGWIEEIPGVNSQGKTKTEMMKNYVQPCPRRWRSIVKMR
jgi:predicted RNase H-like HicB family nuclease